MVEYAPHFGLMTPGDRINLVASVVAFDNMGSNHLMNAVISRNMFSFVGSLPPGKLTHSLLNVRVLQPAPRPILTADEESRVLSHDACTWDSVRETVELCSGLGGLGQGLLSVGFVPVLAVDHNPLMLDLYGTQSPAALVRGDIAEVSTIAKIWELHPRSSTICAGIACQPYSALGDRGSGQDPRAQSLPATLAAAHYLRAVVIILECVSPAQGDSFVRSNIDRFCRLTGFHCTEEILRLQDCWPCSRNRWWAILSAPALGPIKLRQLPAYTDCNQIQHVMPYVIRWPFTHEHDLALIEAEKQAFQVDHEDGCPYLVNRSGILPCPLHAWGSQLRSCPCKCRLAPLSSERLQHRGLFGVVIRSACDCNGLSNFRHIHPFECAGLVGLDPAADYGDNALLTLSGIGQIASPIQAAWVGSHVMSQFEFLKDGTRSIHPTEHLHAYRSWLLARCQIPWPSPENQERNALTRDAQLWEPVVLHTMHELLQIPARDFVMTERCLAVLFRQLQEQKRQHVSSIPSILASLYDDDCCHLDEMSDSDEPEPEVPAVFAEPPKFQCVEVPEGCVAILYPPGHDVAFVKVAPSTTVQQLLEAESRLYGFEWTHVTVYKMDGTTWDMHDVISPGQMAQLCVVPRGQPGDPEHLGWRPALHGFPGMCGQRPMLACREGSPGESGLLPYKLPVNVPAEAMCAGSCASSSASLGPSGQFPHLTQAFVPPVEPDVSAFGECGPLPFRLPAGTPGLMSLEHPDLPNPATGVMEVDEVGESGPLPCKLPDDAARTDVPAHGPLQECEVGGTLHQTHHTPSSAGTRMPEFHTCAEPERSFDAVGHAPIFGHQGLAKAANHIQASDKADTNKVDLEGECGPLPTIMPAADPATCAPECPDASATASGCAETRMPWMEGQSQMISCSPIRTHASPAGDVPFQGAVAQSPLVHLNAESLCRMQCSFPTTQVVVNSMRQQVVTVHDRQLILAHQGALWADDELSWHLSNLKRLCAPHMEVTD